MIGDKHDLLIAPRLNANRFHSINSQGMTQLGIRSIFAFLIMKKKLRLCQKKEQK